MPPSFYISEDLLKYFSTEHIVTQADGLLGLGKNNGYRQLHGKGLYHCFNGLPIFRTIGFLLEPRLSFRKRKHTNKSIQACLLRVRCVNGAITDFHQDHPTTAEPKRNCRNVSSRETGAVLPQSDQEKTPWQRWAATRCAQCKR